MPNNSIRAFARAVHCPAILSHSRRTLMLLDSRACLSASSAFCRNCSVSSMAARPPGAIMPLTRTIGNGGFVPARSEFQSASVGALAASGFRQAGRQPVDAGRVLLAAIGGEAILAFL